MSIDADIRHGIRANLGQFLHQLLQVLRRRFRDGHGHALPESVCCDCRHLCPALARIGDRHLSFLARPRLQLRRTGVGLAASTNSIEGAFWFVAIAMALSGLVLLLLGEETHPRINPASVTQAK